MHKVFELLILPLFLLFLPLTMFPRTATAQSVASIVESYVEKYKDIAIDEMRRAGVPASIKLAQAILESNAGRSHLATRGNNHFGIKCGKYWTGKTMMREDDDYKNGKLMKSCFRAFPSASFSFVAHSEFLLDPKKDFRYGFLFKLEPTDYAAWAQGLKKAGYASDPNYPKRLISIIERYQLAAYDNSPLAAVTPAQSIEENIDDTPPHVVTAESTSVVTEEAIHVKESIASQEDLFLEVAKSYSTFLNNKVEYIRPENGDKLSVIALELGLDIKDLVANNEYLYGTNQTLSNDILVYIEPKRVSYSGRRKTYRLSPDESLSHVAQKFGIREKNLRRRNRWSKNYQPKTGEVVYLRGKRKKK